MAAINRLHNHPLVRHNNATAFYSQDAFVCNLCSKSCRGKVFHCSSCNFDACPSCMSTHLRNNAKHVHPLTRYTSSPYGPNKPSMAVCDTCRATVKHGEEAYHCDTCRNYDNCRTCYNKYQVPHQHPMRQFDRAPYNSRSYNCDYCSFSYGETPGYHCDACGNFDACPTCYGKFAAGPVPMPGAYPAPGQYPPSYPPTNVGAPGAYPSNPLPGTFPSTTPGAYPSQIMPPPGGHPPGVQAPPQPVNISVNLAVNQPPQHLPGQYPPTQPGYTAQPGAPLNFPGQPGQYPPQQGGYPSQGQPQPGQYPPQQGGYPPQSQPQQPGQYPPNNQQLNFPGQPGYPPQQGGYPPQGQPQQPGYQTGQYPQTPGYQTHPPGQYPPQQGGYPPQGQGQPQQPGQYPPQQGAYPPQQGQPQPGQYPPQQGGYPPQGQPQQPGQYPPSSNQPLNFPGGQYPPQQGTYPSQPGQYPPNPQNGYPPQQPGQYPPYNGKPTPY